MYYVRVCRKSTDPITTDWSNYNWPPMIGSPIVIGLDRMEKFNIQLDRFGSWMAVPTGTDRTDPIHHPIKNRPTNPIPIQLSSDAHHPIYPSSCHLMLIYPIPIQLPSNIIQLPSNKIQTINIWIVELNIMENYINYCRLDLKCWMDLIRSSTRCRMDPI